MRSVSGYLADDGRFFTDKKEAEAYERLLAMDSYIADFLRTRYDKRSSIEDTLRDWERFKHEAIK